MLLEMTKLFQGWCPLTIEPDLHGMADVRGMADRRFKRLS